VLAVGIVVDDAIVVVENVERNMALGMSAREAAHRTMDEVSGALIAIALTLCAVFVPSAFISGISGLFFKQFAITIAASTVISFHKGVSQRVSQQIMTRFCSAMKMFSPAARPQAPLERGIVRDSPGKIWQRVRGSNPCFGLERALIFLRKMLINSDL
jgi:hypothetical protein